MKGFGELRARSLILLASLGVAGLGLAEPAEKEINFSPPITKKAVFGTSLSMLDQERADYAKNLAHYSINMVIEKKGSDESLVMARRLLAVALHLSPRNRDALVVTFQLQKGVLPKKTKKMDYSPEVFSRLLLSRAELLGKQKKEQEKLLARCFIELSALIDPHNEDAVYAFQIQNIDHGELNWTQVTDAVAEEAQADVSE